MQTRRARSDGKSFAALYTVSEVARLAGCSSASLRRWEQDGLIKSRRSPGGYRLYGEPELALARRISYLRSVGKLNVPGIRRVLQSEKDLPDRAEPQKADRLGSRLLSMRRRRHLTLRQAAKGSGLSASFISSIERGKTRMTIATMRRLLGFYGSSPAELRGKSESKELRGSRLTRPDQRRVLMLLDGVKIENLATSNSKMEAQLITVAPGGGSQGTYEHEGEEFIFVLGGALEVRLDDERRAYHLKSGDCLYFPSSVPHMWRNIGRARTQVLWANSPPSWRP